MRSLLTFLFGLTTALTASAQADFTTREALFGDLSARSIGPAIMSGRVSCLAVDPTDPNIVYVGAGGGGIWKTTSGGSNVQPIFDDHTQSIGALAIAPSDPETIYAGTGEAWVRNSVSVGTGVYRSTDGGRRWQSLGLDSTERISGIVVHPDSAQVAYVAALGPLWSDGTQRGVYKTSDGGQSWARVLYLDASTGAADISIDPQRPERIFVAMWSHRRTAWSFDSGYGGTSGLYRTTDGGSNWALLSDGLPDEKLGRIGVTVAPGNGEVVYASVETASKETSGMYRSDDGGDHWQAIDHSFSSRVRPFYFANLSVDPSNDSIVAKCGREGIISENRGAVWRNLSGSVHSDWHDIWIDPANGKHLLAATDGGVYESYDRGYTFRMWNNLPLSQFYHVSVDNAEPYRVYGGLQDNGSWYAPSSSPGGISNADWTRTFGGDGFYSFRHPHKPHIVFSEYQGGKLIRWDERTGRSRTIAPFRTDDSAPLRFNWNAPVHLSADGERLYFASQYLYRSNDDGDSWQRISPDLTTNDTAYQQQYRSGGLTIDNSGAENYTTVYAIAESPLDQRTVWAGTDDGNLQLTTDGGQHWQLVTPSDTALPEGAWVTFVEASPHDANTALVTFDAHRQGDMTPYLYRTTDAGKSWMRLHHEALEGYALSVRQDPVNADLLYLGTEFGLYLSLDGGSSWAPFRNGVPRVGVRDMAIQSREADLVLATHGRGVLIIDDLEALRQLTPSIVGNGITFLDTDTTYFYDGGAGGAGVLSGNGHFVGRNPSEAARILYYADKRHTFGKMYVEIYRDSQLVRTLPAGKGAGLNSVELNITTEKPKAPPSDNRAASFGTVFGPILPAGTYRVNLVKGKNTYETTFAIAAAPGSPYSVADRAEQYALVTQLYADTEELAYLYEVLDRVETQADTLRLATIAERAGKLKSGLVFLGGDGYVNEGEQLGELVTQLYGDVAQFPGKPSGSQRDEATRLHRLVERAREQVDRLLDDVARANEKLEESKRMIYPEKEAFLGED